MRIATLALLSAGVWLTSCSHPSASSGASEETRVPWMSVDKSARTVTFNIQMAANAQNQFNFNGYVNGELTISVPRNWKVRMKVTNQSTSTPHSLEIASVSGPEPMAGIRPAFSGAVSKDLIKGFRTGEVDEISFVADEPGTYQMLCGVDGHAAAGMWDYFVVSGGISLPSVHVK